MRSRNLKPGFFKNEDLAQCAPLARLLFSGLWCLADKEGRAEDRPLRIKAEILPYDDCDIEQLLAQLQERGFIVRYISDGRKCLAIPTFLQHQRPHTNEQPSTLPAPPKVVASTQGLCAKDESTLDQGAKPAQPRSDPLCSSSLNPSSLNPSNTPPTPPTGGKRQRRKATYSPAFEAFWKAYPNKAAKPKAAASWQAKSGDAIVGIILAAVEEQKTWRTWQEGYVPHAATWLNQERWTDEPPPPRVCTNGHHGNGAPTKQQQADELIERMKRERGEA